MPRIEFRQLTKCFSGDSVRPALDKFDLEVRDQELMVVVGPSGAGKTTLLRLIAGLETVDQGQILFDGRPMNNVRPADRQVSMTFQSPALYPHFNVQENLGFGLKLRRFPRQEIKKRVLEAADFLGLNKLLERRPETLSGGERQRVALGRVLVLRPKILLLDEPLANLDPLWHDQLRAEIRRVHQNFPVTMIYVTHDQREAMRMGERIAILDQGSLHQVGSPLELYRQPADMFVARFFGRPAMNLVPGRLVKRSDAILFCFSGQELAVPRSSVPCGNQAAEIVAGWRPERLEIQRATPSPRSLLARVDQIESAGADDYWRVTVGSQKFTVRTCPEETAKRGDSVWLELKFERALWFDPTTGRRLV